jgi:HK97 family phage prohead protease
MVVRKKGMELAIRDGPGLLKFLRGVDDLREVEVIAEVALAVPDTPAAPTLPPPEGEENRSVPWVFSTFGLDRYSERIDPGGWELERYVATPVSQWAHLYDIPAIGRAVNLFADESGLHGSIVFNDKAYDRFGWSIGERVKAGVLRAGSVGFRPIEVEIPSKADAADGTALIFRRQELLEFSICNVPANPWALLDEKKQASALPAAKEGISQRRFWGGFIGGRSGATPVQFEGCSAVTPLQ